MEQAEPAPQPLPAPDNPPSAPDSVPDSSLQSDSSLGTTYEKILRFSAISQRTGAGKIAIKSTQKPDFLYDLLCSCLFDSIGMSSETPTTPGAVLEDAATVHMDGEAWLKPSADAATSASPSRSTVVAPAVPVLPPVIRAFELQQPAPAQVETPFASPLRSLGVAPLEGTSESRPGQQGGGGGSRELLLANPSVNRRDNISSYDRLHRQHVVYAEGIGPAFIHLFTGTL